MNAVRDADAATPLLHCRGLDVGVASRLLVGGLDLELRAGSALCVLGRNGAGKTTTLHTLAGLRPAGPGELEVDGRRLRDWDRRHLARRLGLLMQSVEDPFPSTVLEAVLIGRHPHLGFWQWESDIDRSIARDALASVGLAGLEAREVATLSGGERRRVAVAAMLTQDPAIYLLDEPINHLDPHHQIDVLRLFRARADAGASVAMSLHDAGLAARFCDRALLLFGDGKWLCGPTDEVLNTQTMQRMYGVAVRELTWPGGRTFVAED